MQHRTVSKNYPWLPHNAEPDKNPTPPELEDIKLQVLGDRQAFYDHYINGCQEKYGKKGRACISNEKDRVAMTLRQPQSMQNYTEMGFKKIKAPADVFKLISEFWDINKDERKPEGWPTGNTYVNHWNRPSYMTSIENTKLRGAGYALKQKIWNAAKAVLQEWTGQELTQTSLYGVRTYVEGAVLASHVDRLPLVSSAIINVAQDVDEPWPLEVISHDGKAYNVTMEPGDMVLYESHSVIHGRPFPLKGRFFSNIFIHFEPVGHSLRHHDKEAAALLGDTTIDSQYREASKNDIGGHEGRQHDDGLPAYLLEHTPEEAYWKKTHPGKWKPSKDEDVFATGSTNAHTAAARGDIASLRQIAESEKSKLDAKDVNGWRPIHEAVRAGHKEVVELLVDHGADIDARTGILEDGSSALWLAIERYGENHPVAEYLRGLGAQSIEPEL